MKERLKKKNTSQLSTIWVSRDEEGNYNKNNSTKEIYTDIYLDILRIRDLQKMNVVNWTLSTEEYCNFWKKKREKQVHPPLAYMCDITKRCL